MNAKELRARLQEIAARMTTLANAESLDEAGQAEFDELAAEAEERQAALDRLETARRATEDAANREIRTSPVPRDGVQLERANFGGEPRRYGTPVASAPSGHRFITSDGRELRAYSHNEPLAAPEAAETPSIGRLVRCLLTGNMDELQDGEQRQSLGGLDSAGGYLLSPLMSAKFVDMARSASICGRAGMQILPISGETCIARLASDPDVTWRRELEAIPASSPVFERVVLRPRTLATICPVSVELLEDGANVESLIENSIRAAMGQELDRAVLDGDGSAAAPLGLLRTSGIESVAVGGTPDSYQKLIDAVAKVLTRNFPGDISELTLAWHPLLAAVFAGLTEATEGQPLREPAWVASLRKMYSTGLPVSAGDYTSVIGDFRELLLGLRTSVRVEVLPAGSVTDSSGTTTNAASQLARLVRVYMRCDSAVLQPGFFCALTGATVV